MCLCLGIDHLIRVNWHKLNGLVILNVDWKSLISFERQILLIRVWNAYESHCEQSSLFSERKTHLLIFLLHIITFRPFLLLCCIKCPAIRSTRELINCVCYINLTYFWRLYLKTFGQLLFSSLSPTKKSWAIFKRNFLSKGTTLVQDTRRHGEDGARHLHTRGD